MMQSLFKTKEDVTNTLYVVSVIFNPRCFDSRYRLYNEFKKYLECEKNVKLLTVEIAFADRPFVVTDEDNCWNVQLRTNDEIWHKEAGINVGLQRLLEMVPNAKYAAWIDADVRFSNPHWVRDTIRALHHHKIVQPYAEAINMNYNNEYMWNCPSVFRKHANMGYHQRPPIPLAYFSGGHPGLAWAGRIDTITKLGGLLDVCVAGSADTHMANALRGDALLFLRPGVTEGFKKALVDYQIRCDEVVEGNVGYVHGICFHYWHGKSEERGYEKRWDIMAFHQFDPEKDIIKCDNGLYRFAGNKPQFEQDLKLSMSGRNEDAPY